MTQIAEDAPEEAVAHLEPATWAWANREMLRKIIAELAHEGLLEPQWRGETEGVDQYRLEAPTGTVYLFRGRRLMLDHWHIDTESIKAYAPSGEEKGLDALAFMVEWREQLGLGPETMPEYLEEMTATLYANAYKLSGRTPRASELIQADFQQIEAAMTEGHPAFIANSGRIGFDAVDYRRYAPETGRALQLIWLAAHDDRVAFAASATLDYDQLLERELSPAQRARFEESLRSQGLSPGDYWLIPAHPWQWNNKLASVFAPDLATRHLVCLGPGEDHYQPQQSIRTLFNCTRLERCYVKTALSVLNMGFMRGLSPDYMSTTPPINDWVNGLIEADPELRATGFGILREVAAVGYRHPLYEEAADKTSPYRKMLAALWRESPVPHTRPDQQLMTMAALLHRDPDGEAVVSELIRASGLDAVQWLDRYLQAYLLPLLHCFYRHDLVFMPHGENLILVLEDYVPVRCFIKDIAEEVAVMDQDAQLPEEVQRIAVPVPEDLRVLSLFTDVFDYFFRYLAAILDDAGDCPEELFWDRVAACVRGFQDSHPELAEKFARDDLFAPEFRRSCLNRLQLANNRQLIDLADPAGSLQFAGMLQNPIGRQSGVTNSVRKQAAN